MPPPLAERMRPQSLTQYVGQTKLLGSSGSLKRVIQSGQMHSCIFWGPPGVGKTSLAKILAQHVEAPFSSLSAINSGVKDVREAINLAKRSRFFDKPSPVLFIDEIHRFSKSQQDSLLGAVESGVITLIGATTENPSFEVISALLSRCQVYVLEHLSKEELTLLIDKALVQDDFLKDQAITIKEYEALLLYSGGDARKLYNNLEITLQSIEGNNKVITNEVVEKAIQQQVVRYDKQGEMHYDVISAYIKSIRNSDPDASVYYLARMLAGGEDPKFIARRLIISASEDIGLANPNALLIANQVFDIVHKIGMPEARIPLSQATIYLASSPKSNSAYMAINEAIANVKQTGNLPIPLQLRNAPTKLMKELNYGTGYQYAHSHKDNTTSMECLPDDLIGTTFYTPKEHGSEKILKQYLDQLKKNSVD